MGVPLRSPFRIAELLCAVVFASALAACGSQEPASDPTSLAQTAQAHLAAGRVDDARRCAERLLEQGSDALGVHTGSWLLARCAIAEARDESATLVELIALQRERDDGARFTLSALARDEMAVLLQDCRRAGVWQVERWLLDLALAGERLRGVDDEYTQALRNHKRLRLVAPGREPTAIYCDFSSDCASD